MKAGVRVIIVARARILHGHPCHQVLILLPAKLYVHILHQLTGLLLILSIGVSESQYVPVFVLLDIVSGEGSEVQLLVLRAGR